LVESLFFAGGLLTILGMLFARWRGMRRGRPLLTREVVLPAKEALVSISLVFVGSALEVVALVLWL
jgi:hypothetical protein